MGGVVFCRTMTLTMCLRFVNNLGMLGWDHGKLLGGGWDSLQPGLGALALLYGWPLR